MLVKLRFLENELLFLASEPERDPCSNDDTLLAGLFDNVNSVADDIVSLVNLYRYKKTHIDKKLS